jgi:uncharacterized membrane protein YczE
VSGRVAGPLAFRAAVLVSGVTLVGAGAGAAIWANVGVGPFDVVYTALAGHFDMSMAAAVWVVGAAMLLLALGVGGRPGVGTVLVPVLIGPAIQTTLGVLGRAAAPELVLAWLTLVAGIFVIGVGVALIVGADLGVGAAELAAIMIARKLGTPGRWPTVRAGIEFLVLLVGVGLGGAFGLGTVAFVLLIGPAIAAGTRVTSPVLRRCD